MPEIITIDDIKREQALRRCQEALRMIDVPDRIIRQFKPGPMLDQFCHLTVFKEVPWRDALVWINDHKAEIFKHAESFK